MLDLIAQVSIFADLTEEQRRWLQEQSGSISLAEGEILFHEGDPPTCFHVVLSGMLQITKRIEGEETEIDLLSPGMFTGDIGLLIGLPNIATARALQPTQLLVFGADTFQRLIALVPSVGRSMLPLMGARVQGAEVLIKEREKLAALGKMAAGLAHELNNPAAAGIRATNQLQNEVSSLQELTLQLLSQTLKEEQRLALENFLSEVQQNKESVSTLDALALSDLEEELTSWLDNHNVDESWQLASVMASAGVTAQQLELLEKHFPLDLLSPMLSWLVTVWGASRLIKEITHSTTRISDLVKAVKSYSYMDQAPQQEIDIHDGLENTLMMLGHKLKQSISIVRAYDRQMPHITAYGSELNQVWTNLIDNAIDAMQNAGTPKPQITIRTRQEGVFALVEIADTGPGIPEEVQKHIFQPFFTTKKTGTGLGLDISYRIVVNRHHGDIRVVSRPGETRFIIRLPLHAST